MSFTLSIMNDLLEEVTFVVGLQARKTAPPTMVEVDSSMIFGSGVSFCSSSDSKHSKAGG